MFESLIKGKRNLGGHRTSGRDVGNQLGYSRYKNKDGRNREQVAFYIGMNLMRKVRWIVGDRLDLLYDEEAGLGLLKRVPADSTIRGNKISARNSKNIVAVQFCASCGPFPDSDGVLVLENVSVENEGILFSWPKATA